MISKNDLVLIKQTLKEEFDPKFEKIDKQLGSIKKDTKNLHQFAKHFDSMHQTSKKRLDRIEDVLNLSPLK